MILRTNILICFLVLFMTLHVINAFKMNMKICRKRNGAFPKPGSMCKNYYECINFVPVERQCPKDHHFSTIINECDWMDNFPCFERPPNEVCSRPNGRFLKPGTSCKYYYDCCNGKPTEKRCPLLQIFDPNQEKCEWQKRYICEDDASTDDGKASTLSTVVEYSTAEFEETTHGDVEYSTQKFDETTPGETRYSTSESYETTPEEIQYSTSESYETTPEEIQYSTSESYETTPEEIQYSTSESYETTPEEIQYSTSEYYETTPEEIQYSTSESFETTAEDIQYSTSESYETTPEKIQYSTSKSYETTPEEIEHSTTEEELFHSTASDIDEGTTDEESLTTFDIGQLTNEPNIFCPERFGYFPHPFDKHKFVGCVDYIPNILTCPHELIYNHEEKQCVYQE